jgi:GlpG protein
MRLIGTLQNEHYAQRFCAFLKHRQIEATCEVQFDAATGHLSYPIWVHNEDQINVASALYDQFKKNPQSKEFDVPLVEQIEVETEIAQSEIEQQIPVQKAAARVSTFLLILCSLIFFWNSMQVQTLVARGIPRKAILLTPLEGALLYDLPPSLLQLQAVLEKYQIGPDQTLEELSPPVRAALEEAANVPSYRGLYDMLLRAVQKESVGGAVGPLFEKVRAGEVWRLFTPCILHRDFLHILFNLIWLWVLGRPIEQRIGGGKTLLMVLCVGILSNTAQYLMSGPFFLGLSGVVTGLAGFIWMREKKAPWEGYPLHRSTLLFLAIFVLAMFALQAGSFLVTVFTETDFTPNIANTAHIAGALLGIALGRLSFFAARPVP